MFGVPALCTAPFVTTFKFDSSQWCHNDAEASDLFVRVWISFFIVVSMVSICETIYAVNKADKEMAGQLVSTIMLYAVTSLVLWPIRMFLYVTDPSWSVLLQDFFALIYFSIFMREEQSLVLFEAFSNANSEFSSNPNDTMFSWDEDDERANRDSGANNDSNNANGGGDRSTSSAGIEGGGHRSMSSTGVTVPGQNNNSRASRASGTVRQSLIDKLTVSID